MSAADWKGVAIDRLRRLAHGAETRVDRVKRRVKHRLGRAAPARILPYRGFGTPTHFFQMGRVLEDRPVVDPRRDDSWWRNLRAMYHRFETDELPGVRLRLRSGDAVQETVTDEEGYFRFAVYRESPLPSDRLWHDVALELVEPGPADNGGPLPATTAQVLVPRPDSTLGVISDIDDTVLRTDATDLFRTLRITLTGNAHTRLPFAGAAAFYRALQRGSAASGENPVFYVSSSAWNLYDLLVAFLEINGLPQGPILLRDFGLEPDRWVAGDRMHKLHEIRRILRTYPRLPFVLVGDAGERDAEIYQRVVQEHPGRVRAIYIRESSRRSRTTAAERIAAAVREQGVEMLVIPDTGAAAVHAAENGFIEASAVNEIRRDLEKDRGAPAFE